MAKLVAWLPLQPLQEWSLAIEPAGKGASPLQILFLSVFRQ